MSSASACCPSELSEEQSSLLQMSSSNSSEETLTEPSVSDARKTEQPAASFCTNCQDIRLDGMIRYASEFVHGQWTTAPRSLVVGMDCPICDFLGFAPSLPAISGKDKVREMRIELYVMKERDYYGYSFQPCVFKSAVWLPEDNSKIDGKTMPREVRLIMPVANESIAVLPSPPYRPLRPDRVDLDMFREWLTDCMQYHGEVCSPAAEGYYDDVFKFDSFRLIDCKTLQVIRASLDERYVALSYVWGEGVEPQHEPQQQFPNTIHDTIVVARELGFRYLWVDKYCIDQENASEKHDQISRMDIIYQHAALTIIAAAGNNADYGLTGVRAGSRVPQPRVEIDGTTWVSVPAKPSEAVGDSKWHKRGWTYQEGYFSRRRLIFTEEQVIYQCNTASCCELADANPKLAPGEGKFVQPSNSGGFDASTRIYLDATYDMFDSIYPAIRPPDCDYLALQILEYYSWKELSYQSDALNAVRGLFSSLANTKQPKRPRGLKAGPFLQFWGIPTSPTFYYPTSDAERDLFESTLANLTPNQQLYAFLGRGMHWRATDDETSPVRRNGFPSWSWAGWITPVMWSRPKYMSYNRASAWASRDVPTGIWVHTTSGETAVFCTSVLEHLARTHANEASLYTCRLGIETNVVDITMSYYRHSRLGFVVLARDDTLANDGITALDLDLLVWRVDITPRAPEGSALHAALCSETFGCAVMFGHYGIVLRTQNGVSERVGIVHLDASGCSSAARLGAKTLDWEEGKPVLVAVPDAVKHEGRCLVERFPTRKRRILLQ